MCRFLPLIITLLILSYTSQSQTCCSGGSALSGSLGLNAFDQKQKWVSISYDLNHLASLYSESELLDENFRERRSQTLLLQAGWSPLRWFSLNLLMSYVRQDRDIMFNPENPIRTTGQGFGDMILYGQFQAFGSLRRALIMAVGIQIPTGNNNMINEATGIFLPPDLQPGSGSWDQHYAVSYQEYNLLIPKLNIYLSSNYKNARPTLQFEGTRSYQFGNELYTSLGISYTFDLKLLNLTTAFYGQYRQLWPDNIEGNEIYGTGGRWISLIPAIEINLYKLNLFALYNYPVLSNVNGIQLSSTYKFRTGVRINLNKQSIRTFDGF